MFACFPFARAWELRVCAEPNNMPFSNRAEEGYENRIAKIVAAELGATLSYEWLPATPRTDRLLYLRRGDCDMVVGVGDGTEGLLTTVAYYDSAPVFVYREDAPFEVTSFDDEILRELRIAVLAGAGVRPEVAALANRDLMSNVVSYSWAADDPAPLAAPVEAVAAGEVDIAVLWGPVGSYFGERHEVPLQVVSAEPKVDLPFLNLIVPMTMGVRPGDESLRDLLSRAIAARWEEIQGVLNEYDVPLEPQPPPALPSAQADAPLRVGLALPLPSGPIPLEADAPHTAAFAAQMGATLAEERLGAPAEGFAGLELLLSNTPSAASAGRAAERMIASGAAAVVGGFGGGQAEELARVAAAAGVPFLDIGSSLPASTCSDFTFHVEASDRMYLAALAGALSDSGLTRLLVAYPESPAGERLLETARAQFARYQGLELVQEVAVSGEQELIGVALAAKQADAQAIVALLDWRAQLDLAGFMGSIGEGIALTGYPHPVTQTRSFYYSLLSLEIGPAPRIALWDASLDDGAAAELNETYFARWGEPMDPSAWAGYLALALVTEAARDAEGQPLVDSLERVELDLEGIAALGFGPHDHQLRHTLYRVAVDPEAGSREEAVSVVQRFGPAEDAATGCD